MKLRDYQREAVDSIYQYFDSNDGNPLIVLPTASGKSFVMAEFIREVVTTWPDHQILVLTHVKELIEQNYKELTTIWPLALAGIYSAGLNRKDTRDNIIFAGIQSIYKKANSFPPIDLILIDECHLVSKNSDTMYRKFLDDVQEINPFVKVIGLTATQYRMSSGLLTSGKDRLFTDVAYEVGVRRLIDEQYLSPLIGKLMSTRFDLNGVHTRAGDFVKDELAERMDKDELTRTACREIMEYGHDRKSWIIYCSGIAHAEHVATELWSHGITAVAVSGEDPPGERRRKIEGFKSGNIQALTNCDLLTTGFNHPGIDQLVFLRPTKSTGLYVQIAGRGMRNAPGKENCLILDFAGNIERHGPIDLISPIDKLEAKAGPGVAPIKTCPECRSIVFAGVRICPVCGYEFPKETIKHKRTATTRDPISRNITIWVDVIEANYNVHYKRGFEPGSVGASISKTAKRDLPPPTLRVEYLVDESGEKNLYREWICVEHTGFAKQKAITWFQKRGIGFHKMPTTVEDAMATTYDLPIPERLMIKPDGKYFRIALSQGMKLNPAKNPYIPDPESAVPVENDLGFDDDTPF